MLIYRCQELIDLQLRVSVRSGAEDVHGNLEGKGELAAADFSAVVMKLT